jgi:hypothetical protein
MIKNREEIEKEFFNDFGNTGAWEELDNIALYISKIRQDDIDELVEFFAGYKKPAEDDYDGGYNHALSDVIAHLHKLKKHI